MRLSTYSPSPFIFHKNNLNNNISKPTKSFPATVQPTVTTATVPTNSPKVGMAASDAWYSGVLMGAAGLLIIQMIIGVLSPKKPVPLEVTIKNPEDFEIKPKHRSGMVDKILPEVGSAGLLSAALNGPVFAILVLLEKGLSIFAKADETVDAPAFFEAKRHLYAAKTILTENKHGYFSFSDEARQEYHRLLNMAGDCFRSAGAEFTGTKKILQPIYTLCEVGTNLLNCQPEIARYTATRCIEEYKDQLHAYHKLRDENWTHMSAEQANSPLTKAAGLFGIITQPLAYPILKILDTQSPTKTPQPMAEPWVKSTWNMVFDPTDLIVINRAIPYYNYESSNIETMCNKLLTLPSSHQIFNLLPSK